MRALSAEGLGSVPALGQRTTTINVLRKYGVFIG
jgi:hypothetical protein